MNFSTVVQNLFAAPASATQFTPEVATANAASHSTKTASGQTGGAGGEDGGDEEDEGDRRRACGAVDNDPKVDNVLTLPVPASSEIVLSSVPPAAKPEAVSSSANDPHVADKSSTESVGGYVPLGHVKMRSVVWSNNLNSIVELGPRDAMNVGHLITICGGDWIAERYSTETRGKVKIDYQRAGADLIDACQKIKTYQPDKVRGSGVWREGNDLVVNSIDAFRASDGKPADRVGGAHIYPSFRDLGVEHDTPHATLADTSRVAEFLSTFNWTRKSDARMVGGWLMMAYLTGALDWRPHFMVHAPRGSGKSSLKEAFARFLGGACVSVSSQGRAGLQQALMNASVASLIDEAGATGSATGSAKLEGLLQYLRASSDGSVEYKGTAEFDHVRFEVRTAALLLGVTPARMEAQDRSRFYFASLGKLPDGQARHELFPQFQNQGSMSDLGLRLFSRALKKWPQFLGAQKLISQILSTQADNRSGDTVSPILAGVWVMENDGELAASEAAAFVDQFDLADEFEDQKSNETIEPLRYLLETSAPPLTAGGIRRTVIELVMMAAKPRPTQDEREVDRHLRGLGIIVCPEVIKVNTPRGLQKQETGKTMLKVDPGNVEFKRLFEKSEFRSHSLWDLMKRADGATYDKSKTARFPAGPRNFVGIPIDLRSTQEED